MAQQDAKTAYTNIKSDIASLLGWFECELNKTPGKIDWTHVGTLNKVKQDLLETLSFLSGFEVETVRESLAENRMLEEADAEIENERQ
jgi:hypothetical protein